MKPPNLFFIIILLPLKPKIIGISPTSKISLLNAVQIEPL